MEIQGFMGCIVVGLAVGAMVGALYRTRRPEMLLEDVEVFSVDRYRQEPL